MINIFKENKTIDISTSIIEPDSWGCIAEGYYWSSKILFDHILSSDQYQNRWVIYSLLFNIRHYYELSLKDILVNLGFIANDNFLLTNHKIDALISKVEIKAREYYKSNKDRIGNRLLVHDIDSTIEEIKAEINFFIVYDNDSYSFRYPYAINGGQSIENTINLNHVSLYESFKSCRKLLSSLITEVLCDDNNPIFRK